MNADLISRISTQNPLLVSIIINNLTTEIETLNVSFKKWYFCSGWYGSMDGALACESEGCGFDSQSRHIPGLQARSPVGGVQEATTLMLLSLSFSVPSPLSKNK